MPHFIEIHSGRSVRTDSIVVVYDLEVPREQPRIALDSLDLSKLNGRPEPIQLTVEPAFQPAFRAWAAQEIAAGALVALNRRICVVRKAVITVSTHKKVHLLVTLRGGQHLHLEHYNRTTAFAQPIDELVATLTAD